jgi:hypothetical protein
MTMTTFKTLSVALAALVLLSGCAGGTQMFLQNGQTAYTWPEVPVDFLRDTPQPPPRECPISQLIDVKYVEERKWPWWRADKWFSDDKPNQFFKTCPDIHMVKKEEVNVVTWAPVEVKWSPSVMRTIGPSLTTGLGFVAAAGTLGATMPATKVTQHMTSSALAGSRFSTGYFQAIPAPAWLGQ